MNDHDVVTGGGIKSSLLWSGLLAVSWSVLWRRSGSRLGAGGLVFALTYPETWRACLAFAQLALRWHTPVRLMRFLEDARERQVLRTVGPLYQFRHARLQDRLAEQADAAVHPEPPGVGTEQGVGAAL